MKQADGLKTPLKKVRGLGSAKSGTEHFWHQRVTGAANIPLVLLFIWFVISHLGSARAEIIASLQNPFWAIALVLALASIFWHMRLGLQVVIEDYVHAPAPKFVALAFNLAFPAVLFALSVYSILNMSFA
jgi:succinate dehydrogenase / fumarate reductase, membrane anchor subunit